ncbi:MAG: hypothetical protein ACI8XM_000043 [Haloarculaceae archaeon]|jgi:hypothetical protein
MMDSSQSRTHRPEQPASVETTPVREASMSSSGSELSISVPNERDGPSRVAFVEAVLVELSHEPVSVVYKRPQAGGCERMEVVCVDELGQEFAFRQYVPRHGWSEERVERSEVRSKLLSLVSQSPSAGVDNLASMRVQPLSELHSRSAEADR